ncbi:MarR family winged helix-turn-helix transcriptional regulator [Polyangium mundeleinium]|uniref:MarR family transcriptional regulator n=1 Tax=Polyangium mundeleinium TaxID=2995306 RepID=A0ABT5EUA5_9BACT|nr:MarR family transcriptional regulator [Polyangium mundeleinium]MDC0744922.1 MarR family transcriptional regulator [Polyangium mundeleinium]
MTKAAPVDPSDLDVGSLALFVGYTLSAEVLGELRAAGHPDLRMSHGLVFQHLLALDRTISELAKLLGVTQQAASKSAAELESLGYLTRVADPADARVRRLRLSARAHDAITCARAARARIDRTLAKQLGKERLASTRQALAEILELFGGADAVRARRVRPPE